VRGKNNKGEERKSWEDSESPETPSPASSDSRQEEVGPEDHSSSEDDTAAYEYKLEELTVGDVLVFAGNDLVPWLCVVEKVTLSLARVAYLKKDGEKGVWVRDKGMGVISVLHDPEKNGKKGELGLGNILGIVDWVHKNDVKRKTSWIEGGIMSTEEWTFWTTTVEENCNEGDDSSDDESQNKP